MEVKETLVTPVCHACDVLVCGGGIAGIAAALAAAREKKSVILLDRGFLLGGLATAGLVTIYLPLCDGLGRQVSFGIAEELLLLCKDIKLSLPENWKAGADPAKRTEKDPRYESRFNPQIYAVMAEQLLLAEGVTLLYGTYAVGVKRTGRHIDCVIVENKSGRSAIKAKSVVDATGDADIAHFAGCACETFKQGNILASWYYSACEAGGYRLHPLGVCDIPDDQKTDDNAVELLRPDRFTGLDGDEISRFTQYAHGAFWKDFLQEKDPGCEPATLFTIPQLRMTRRLAGAYTLDDKEMHTYFADSVGMVADWRKRGPVYEVPFGTLYTPDCANLIMAGRCTSVTEPMWDIMRVIPCCSVTGQAAGTAAALTDDFAALDTAILQARLTQAGVVLHEKDLSPSLCGETRKS